MFFYVLRFFFIFAYVFVCCLCGVIHDEQPITCMLPKLQNRCLPRELTPRPRRATWTNGVHAVLSYACNWRFRNHASILHDAAAAAECWLYHHQAGFGADTTRLGLCGTLTAADGDPSCPRRRLLRMRTAVLFSATRTKICSKKDRRRKRFTKYCNNNNNNNNNR